MVLEYNCTTGLPIVQCKAGTVPVFLVPSNFSSFPRTAQDCYYVVHYYFVISIGLTFRLGGPINEANHHGIDQNEGA